MRVKSRGDAQIDESKIALNAGALRALGELQRSDLSAFKQACEELCASEHQSIFIDLARCAYISSVFIGELADAVMRMTASGKDVHVEVSPEIGKTLHMARLYHLFDYEISSEIL